MKKNAGKTCRILLGVLIMLLACTAVSFGASPAGDALVMMDGKYISFNQDSLPKNVNGRIMVPYRAIFEYLGLSVGYDQATGVISGKTDGFTLSMKNQDPVITMTYADGTVKTKTMDVAPYISGGRTFVPTRFVSEMLGYSVGWDSENRTVIIIDCSGIVADAEEHFSVLEKLRNISMVSTKAYELKGTITAEAQTGVSVSMKGDFSGIAENGNEDMVLRMEMKAGEEQTSVEADVKYDMATGDLYMKAPGVTEEKQWIKMNLSSMFGSQDVDLQKILSQTGKGADLTEILADMIADSASDYRVTTYNEMQAVYQDLKELLGDQNFEKKDRVYTAQFDQNVGDAAVKGSITITTDQNDDAIGYSMDLKTESDGMEIAMSVAATASTSEFSVQLENAEGSVMNVRTSISMIETTKHADVTIPSGEFIVDLDDLLGDLFGGTAA